MKIRPARVIPVLLVHEGGLYKSIGFQKLRYVGDPVNAVRVFNDKEVDELVVLDIDASPLRRSPNWQLLEELASEAFMPVCYGGGVSSLDAFDRAFACGVEKICVNSAALADPSLVEEAATKFGSQSIAVCIDVKRHRRGWEVRNDDRRRLSGDELGALAKSLEAAGAGELIVQSVDRDGTFGGYDLELVRTVVTAVRIPVIALGGASGVDDFRAALATGAAGVAAGSVFVFHGPRRAVLISYLDAAERASLG